MASDNKRDGEPSEISLNDPAAVIEPSAIECNDIEDSKVAADSPAESSSVSASQVPHNVTESDDIDGEREQPQSSCSRGNSSDVTTAAFEEQDGAADIEAPDHQTDFEADITDEPLDSDKMPAATADEHAVDAELTECAERGTDRPQDAAGSIENILRGVEERILSEFVGKLKYDEAKDEQIRSLHKELQEYRQGVADSALKPLVMQLIRYLNQLPRHIESLRSRMPEDPGIDHACKELDGVREDLEIMLENVGVTLYQNPDNRFNPSCQQARLTEPTDDPEKHQQLQERLLPGYELNGRIVEKECVKVLVHRN